MSILISIPKKGSTKKCTAFFALDICIYLPCYHTLIIWLKKLSTEELMLLNCGVGENSWETLGLQGVTTSQSYRKSVLNIHWKDWCWSWNPNTLATWCEEPTHWKRLWCWESLKAGGDGDDRGWDDWMASLTQWTWIRANSWRWWRTGKPGMLQSMGCRVGNNWATEQQSYRAHMPR